MLKIKKILSPIVPKDSFLQTDKKRFFNLFQDLYEQVLLILDLFTLTQEKLISSVNIKTINGHTLLGEGNLEIEVDSEIAKWGHIIGNIRNQQDLIELIKKTGVEIYKIRELIPQEGYFVINDEDRDYLITNRPMYVEVQGVILSKVVDLNALTYSFTAYDNNVILNYALEVSDFGGVLRITDETLFSDKILSKTNTGVGVEATDKVIVGGDVKMGNVTIKELDADVTTGGKTYNFGNLIVDVQKGAENDVKGVTRNALIYGRSNNVTGVQQALLMGNDNTITTTSTDVDGFTINLAPIIGYRNTLTLNQGIPHFPIIGSYNEIKKGRGLSSIIGTYNSLTATLPFTNIYGQYNRADAGQNNIIGYFNGVSDSNNAVYGVVNSIDGKQNTLLSDHRYRWEIRVTGSANATTYTYTYKDGEIEEQYVIKVGAYLIANNTDANVVSKITAVDYENKTLTVDKTLSKSAASNLLITLYNSIFGTGNLLLGSGDLVEGSDQTVLGHGLYIIDNPQNSTIVGYFNDYDKKGRFVIADGGLNARHNAMTIDTTGNIEFTPKEGAKVSISSPLKMGNVSIKKVDNTQTNPSTGVEYKFGSFILDTQEGAENIVTGTDYRDALIWGRSNNIKNPQMASVIGVDNTVTSTKNSAVLSQTPIFGNGNNLNFGSSLFHQGAIIGNTNTITNGAKQVHRTTLIGHNNTLNTEGVTVNYGDDTILGTYNNITLDNTANTLNVLGNYNTVNSSGQRNSVFGSFNIVNNTTGNVSVQGHHNEVTSNSSNILGWSLKSSYDYQTVVGRYNEDVDAGFVVGDGTNETDGRHNAIVVGDRDIELTPRGKVKYNGNEIATKNDLPKEWIGTQAEYDALEEVYNDVTYYIV